MALNVSFDGFICLVGVEQPNAYVQPYFKKVNAGSSDSQWGPVRQADGNGYYGFNLGDGDFLTQDGSASVGDIVIIASWQGDADRTSDLITNASYVVVTLDGGSVYTRGFNLGPIDFIYDSLSGVPASVERLTNFNFNNNTVVSSAIGAPTGITGAVQSSEAQWYPSWANQQVEIFPALRTVNTTIDFDYPQGDEVAYTYAGYGDPPYGITKQLAQDGGSTVTLRITAASDARGSNQLQLGSNYPINVLWRTPTHGLTPDTYFPTINTLITWTPSITVPDASAGVTVDYSFDGGSTWLYQGVATTFQPTFQYATNGPHTVTQRLHWNDGFSDQFHDQVYGVTVRNIAPVAVISDPSIVQYASVQYTWNSLSTDEDGVIAQNDWALDISDGQGGWTPVDTRTDTDQYTFTFVLAGDYRLTLQSFDDDGYDDIAQALFTVTISGGAGAAISGSVFLTPVGAKGLLK